MQYLDFKDPFVSAVFGGMLGAFLSASAQITTYRLRRSLAPKRYTHDLRNLERHIKASLNSLEETDLTRPSYYIVSRIKYCKFMDRMKSIEQNEWLDSSKMSEKMLPLIFGIRNSDLFLDEIAARIDLMDMKMKIEAIEEAKTNLRMLSKALDSHRL